MSRRKAEMILELIDRATRPARKFMRLQERMGTVSEKANKSAARSSKMAERATRLYTRATRGLGRAQRGLQNGIKRTNRFIDRQTQKLRHSARLMKSGLMGVGGAALVAGGLMTAYAGSTALVASSFLGPARQFEKFQSILKITEGSAQGAQQAMKWVEDFAVKTPYELDQVMDSFVRLRAFGLDPTNGLLETLGNTAAAMGKPVMQAVEAIADAVTGENERLKEFGVKAAKVGKNFEYSYTLNGKTEIVKALASDRAAIEAALRGIFDQKFGGAMGDLSKTFDGMWSNIMDQWGKFQRMVMGFGVFDWMKGKLRGFLDMLDEMEKSGQLEVWAKTIADNILIGLNAIWSFGKSAVAFWRKISPWIIATKDALGGWRNMALLILAIPLRGVILSAGLALLQLAWGAGLAATSLAGIGFGSIAGGALRFGRTLLFLLNPINLIRGAFFALRFAILATGIGAIVVGLAMAGMWIYNNWSGLKAFFVGFGEAFMAALGPARPLVEGISDAASRLWGWISDLIGPIDANAQTWSAWGQSVGATVGEVVSAVIGFPASVITSLQETWGEFKAWSGDMWNNLSTSAAAAWGGLLTLLLNYTPQGLIYTHWDGITSYFSGLWDGVTAVFKNAWSFIESTVIAPMRNAVSFMTDNKLTRGIGSIGSWIKGDNKTPEARATGGPVRGGQAYLVGERGPEIFTPPISGKIIPNNKAFAPARAMALSAGIAASALALPATAENTDSANQSNPAQARAARYVKPSSAASISISAPMEFKISGNVDSNTLDELKAHLEQRLQEHVDAIEDQTRRGIARGHE